jgi:putative sterol carrier protein
MGSDPTTTFFDELAHRGYDPMLRNVSGTARFEVGDGKRTDHWLVTIDKGTVGVSRKNTRPETIVRSSRKTFDGAASGKVNVMAAVLRGEIEIGGDPRLLVLLQRLVPRPSGR